MIRAVVFDLWNTLVETPGGSPFKRMRESLTQDQAARFPALADDAMRHPYPDSAAFLDHWQGAVGWDPVQREAVEEAFTRASRDARMVPGATEALARTRELARVALLSNSQGFDMDLLDRLGLRAQFRVLGLSAELGAQKPEPAAFEAVQKRLGLFPGELAMVGDSWEDDVRGALDAGWTAVWLNRTGAPRPEHDPDADLVEVRALAQVPEVIGRLQAGARCSTCLG